MFLNNIYQAIDRLGNSKFVNDKIILELNESAHFFLATHANFERMYEEKGVSELWATRVIGLILKKDQTNSIGDKVNPELLENLKNKAVSLLSLLGKDWIIDDKKKGSQITLRNRCKEAKKLSPPHCILPQIAKLYNLASTIEITGFTNGVIVEGEPVDILQFSRILRWEALQANSSITTVINLLMCAKNGEEYFSAYHVPTEITKKIVGLISVLIAPKPILNDDTVLLMGSGLTF